jgi:hypothetical protein
MDGAAGAVAGMAVVEAGTAAEAGMVVEAAGMAAEAGMVVEAAGMAAMVGMAEAGMVAEPGTAAAAGIGTNMKENGGVAAIDVSACRLERQSEAPEMEPRPRQCADESRERPAPLH